MKTVSRVPDRSNFIAHRGASAEAPENTLASIGLALEEGAPCVEFDVRETRDGELFLFHDEKLERLCGRKGRFVELDAASVARLDVGSWFPGGGFAGERPPSLVEAIRLCLERGATPLIERKTGAVSSYLRVFEEMGAADRVILQSFDWVFLAGMKGRSPSLRVGALGKGRMATRRGELDELAPDWIGWRDRDLRLRHDPRWTRERGVTLAVFTVNEVERARRLIESGVEKVITDRFREMSESFA